MMYSVAPVGVTCLAGPAPNAATKQQRLWTAGLQSEPEEVTGTPPGSGEWAEPKGGQGQRLA